MQPFRIPKARIFVVDEETKKNTVEKMELSIYTPSPLKNTSVDDEKAEQKKQWIKTIADIAADMLQVEKGDYIFLWKTKTGTAKSEIYGVYRAISSPYYKLDTPDDKYPFKLRIEKAYDFRDPITEYDVLNNPFSKNALWNIVGKKVADKPRASSPLTFIEVQHLIELLIGKNGDSPFVPCDSQRYINVDNPLCIDLSRTGTNSDVKSLADVNPNDLSYVSKDNNVLYEKVLETVFNQEMSRRNKKFFAPLGINVDEVVWYSNYLPYSIEQSEMDYLIMTSLDGLAINKIFLIEFQKSRIDESHIQRTLIYTKWINETLALGESIAQPILICFNCPDLLNCDNQRKQDLEKMISLNEEECKTKKMQVYTYSIENGQMKFERKR